MCGIAGTVGAVDDCAMLLTEKMLGAMVHRGPDQDGRWRSSSSSGAILGHRRLAIIDVTDAGRQPMVDEMTGVVVVFNGECYNYRELREELVALGRCFISASDTEVVLAAYAQWGRAAIGRLRGMFALAVWDPREEHLLLARDRLGIKPVYFTRVQDRFMFASELRALLATGIVERRIDSQALAAYLWHGFVPGPHTIVRDVNLLQSGTTLTIDRNGHVLSQDRYWQLPRHAKLADQDAATINVRKELERSVEMRLVSDVPLGVFLSGGVDSSVVAAIAQRASSAPVTTFNIGFDEARYDESPYAREVAKWLGTDHHEVTLTERSFEDQLDDAIACLDQPTFDALNSYFVSRAVKEAGLTVALAGTGGDELFGGYTSFVDLPKANKIASTMGFLPARAQRALGRVGARLAMGQGSEIPPQTRWGKLADVLATRGDLLPLYQVSYALFSRDMLNALTLGPPAELRWGLYNDQYDEINERIRGESTLTAISTLELGSFVGERLLRDTDTASMAVSLEVRVPLLDHVFIEAMAGISQSRRFRPVGSKLFLKRMFPEHLPASVFERDKAGFELPMESWCRNRLSHRIGETFEDINLAHAVGLDAETVGRIWRGFRKGGKGIYWSRIWGLYVLLSWCRQHQVYA